MRIFVRMILADGLLPGRPAPGQPVRDARTASIVVLDFGLVKELPEGFGLGLFELMFSMMTLNESAMIRAFQRARLRRPRPATTDTFLADRAPHDASAATPGASRASSPRR